MTHTKFPGLRWDAEGNVHHCETEDDVQPGWTDHHPDSAPAKPVEPKPDDNMTRQHIIAALEEGGIAFKKNAPTDALVKQLRVAVLSALEENNIPYEHGMTTKQLLGLLAPSE